MEFRLDDGQVELQETVARFCAAKFPYDGLRAREGAPLDRSAWRDMAELGVFGLLVPEQAGGSGLGAVEAAIVFEQLGGGLAPGPVLWTALAAPVVPGAVSGETVVAGIDAAAVVDGCAVVEHAADADVLLVVGDRDVAVHRAADLPAPLALEPLDPLVTVGRFVGLGSGEVVGDAAAAAGLRSTGRVLAAAMLSGVSARALDVAREHALARHQFGVPIGSFQAVKHLLADMYVRTVCAQSATYAAAALLDDAARADPLRAGASAKVLAGDAAIGNASAAIQVLGGMGFTWEMPPNYLLKRAWALDAEFGAQEDNELLLGSTMLEALA